MAKKTSRNKPAVPEPPPPPQESFIALASLALVGLMWTFPFLHNVHRYPLTTFYQEWWAALLGIFAAIPLLAGHYWRQPEIPRIALMPIALIAVAMLQFLLGKINYFDQALLYMLYLLWAAVLILLGRQLRETLGLERSASLLAVCLLAGAELNAGAGIIQHYDWHTFLDNVISAKNTAAVFGNMGQPNHFADYITLGLVSLSLVARHWQLRYWQTSLLALPLLFVLVLSGSRTPWLYLLGLAALAWLWQRRKPDFRAIFHFSLSILLGYIAMHLVVHVPWFSAPHGSVTSIERMAGGSHRFAGFVTGGDNAIRLSIWREAMQMMLQSPLLGVGFGQFAWHHFILAPELPGWKHFTGMYNSAHNLPLQLAAETGLAGLLAFFGTLLPFLWRLRQAEPSPALWWVCGLLLVLGVHSLLEYPLWYAYFLGIAAIALGLLDTGVYTLKLRALGRAAVAGVLLLGLLTLTHLRSAYGRLEHQLASQPTSANDTQYVLAMQDVFASTQRQALLRPLGDLFMSSLIVINADYLDEKLALNERVMRSLPANEIVYRQVLLLALAGRERDAELQLERSYWSYPANFPGFLAHLQEMAGKDPAHLDALLKFAVQKFKGT